MKSYNNINIRLGRMITVSNDNGIESNYLVLKNDKDKKTMYGLSISDYKDNNNYVLFDDRNTNINYFIKCDKIYEIQYNSIVEHLKYIPISYVDEVISRLSENIIDSKKISYNEREKVIFDGVVVSINDEYYLVSSSHKKSCYVNKFIECDKNENDLNFKLNGKYYYVSKDSKKVNKSSIDFTIKRFSADLQRKIRENFNSRDYNFGDLISIENQNKKMIYVTSIDDEVYYCTQDSLEIFSGISKISGKKVKEKSGELPNNDKIKLLKKIKRSIEFNNFINEEVGEKVKVLIKEI